MAQGGLHRFQRHAGNDRRRSLPPLRPCRPAAGSEAVQPNHRPLPFTLVGRRGLEGLRPQQFYPLTVDDCKLRKLAVDCFVDTTHETSRCLRCSMPNCLEHWCDQHPAVEVECSQRDWLEKNKDRLPFYFVLEVAKASIAQEHTEGVEPGDRGKCHYHEHNEEVPECE